MSDAREEMLRRIRGALADRPVVPEVPRAYRRTDERPVDALLELLAARLEDYAATVHRAAPDAIAATVAAACRASGVAEAVVPADLPAPWRPDVVALREDDGLSAGELDAIDGVITGCAVAVAESGTLVLDGGHAQGRRAITLVPDVHVCVVLAAQLEAILPLAMARLDPTRPITFVSGPSASSDIELERVEGVHGPRHLHVVLVG